MKTKTFIFLLLFIYSLTSICQGIQTAPSDKAVVYFVRTSSYGFLINFTYYDSAALIGKFSGQGYFRYECEPGYHILWARSENKDFIEAELDAGKIYFIEAIVKTGAIKAGVGLLPIDPNNQKKMKTILKIINKKPPETLTNEEIKSETENYQDVISRGLDKYKNDKGKGKEIKRLERMMFYTN